MESARDAGFSLFSLQHKAGSGRGTDGRTDGQTDRPGVEQTIRKREQREDTFRWRWKRALRDPAHSAEFFISLKAEQKSQAPDPLIKLTRVPTPAALGTGASMEPCWRLTGGSLEDHCGRTSEVILYDTLPSQHVWLCPAGPARFPPSSSCSYTECGANRI